MSENKNLSPEKQDGYVQDTLKEHSFDGIQEFDNRLPNWWLGIMYGGIVFAVLYWIVFHTLSVQPMPHEKFAVEMAEAQEAALARMAESGLSDELLIALSETPDKVTAGRELYVKHCTACHLDQGQGLVGANLTDDVWIHGCAPMDMHATVSNGVATKGMPAWMNQLGPTRVQNVVAYILTLRDTNVTGKAPEGEPCE